MFMHGFVINRLTSVEISGTKYHQKNIVVRSYEHDEPVFGRVFNFIATALQEYYFVLNLLETAGFSEHFHAYYTEFLPPDQKLTFVFKMTIIL